MTNKYSVFLNCTPCQFTTSKTRRGIEYIRYLLSSRGSKSEDGVHNITLIITNKSLLDGRQWYFRSNDTKGSEINLNVSILSSVSESKYNSCDELIGAMTTIKKPENLDDVIILCNHSKRIDDVQKLLVAFHEERINLTKFGITKIKYTLMFDEVDKIENLNHAISIMSMDVSDIIESVHLITATPDLKTFWKKLKKAGITSLDNINTVLKNNHVHELDDPTQLIESYRKFTDHTIIHIPENKDVVNNVVTVYENYIKKNNVDRHPLRLFSPGMRNSKTHKKIAEYFNQQGFISITINSDKKRAIHYPIGTRHPCFYIDPDSKEYVIIQHPENEYESIEQFNRRVGLLKKKRDDVNMYDTLTLLNKLYFNVDVVITGFMCIERGVTFQTVTKFGRFNFTDLIMPSNSTICLSSAVQIIGRSNGSKEYVNKHNIYITNKLHTKVNEFINYQMNIIKANPEKITERDFREQTQIELDEPYTTVPMRFQLSLESYNELSAKKGVRYINKRLITEKIKEKYDDINCYYEALCSEPNTENNGWEKNIQPLINAFNNNEKYVTLHKNKKYDKKNYYSVYFDKKNTQMFVMLWNGSNRK